MPKTMQAAYIEKTGSSEVIQFGELALPPMNDDQLLIKVKAVAVNHMDTYIRSGQTKNEPAYPYIIGSDFCGIVEAVGKNVKAFKVGQKVWSNVMGRSGRQGCFANYVVTKENFLYPLPEGVDEIEAVSALQAMATASLGLLHIAKLMPNEILFINGAAGNVGGAVIQLAKERGAQIIASASTPEKEQWCIELGADTVINYKNSQVKAELSKIAPEGVNVYWDTSWTPNLEIATASLSLKGRILLMAGYQENANFNVGTLYRKNGAILGFSMNNATTEELGAAAAMINLCLKMNKCKTKIAKVMPLSEAAKAHQMLEKRDLWGKIVLTV